DSQPDLVAPDFHHGEGDPVPDHNALVLLARQDQHRPLPVRGEGGPSAPALGGTGEGGRPPCLPGLPKRVSCPGAPPAAPGGSLARRGDLATLHCTGGGVARDGGGAAAPPGRVPLASSGWYSCTVKLPGTLKWVTRP